MFRFVFLYKFWNVFAINHFANGEKILVKQKQVILPNAIDILEDPEHVVHIINPNRLRQRLIQLLV